MTDQVFAPHVVQYLEREECNLREELEEALQRETWTSDSGLETSEVRRTFTWKIIEKHDSLAVISTDQFLLIIKARVRLIIINQ